MNIPRRTSSVASLRVARDGISFHAPHAKVVIDLSQRAPLRHIVRLLAERRVEAPGEVIRAGWPGEKPIVEAATKRVYVALATVRKHGLRSILVTGPGGLLAQYRRRRGARPLRVTRRTDPECGATASR